MGDGTPATKSLLASANNLYRIYLTTVNAFPDDTTVGNETQAAFVAACRDATAPRRELRLQQDLAYRNYVVAVVSTLSCGVL